MSETDRYIKNVIEAALLAASHPLKLEELGSLFDASRRPSRDEVRGALQALASEYEERGIEVKETAPGWRVQVRRELAAEVSRLWPERPARYSRALLETLALIAYRQPVTRGEIEAVRGVAVNPNIIKTLIERNWVRVLGQRDVPGHPELLGTTTEFLDYFGLKRLDELPPLAELKTMADLNVQLEFSGSGTGEQVPDERAVEMGATANLAAPGEPNPLGDELDDDEAEADRGEPESSEGLVAAPWHRDRAPE